MWFLRVKDSREPFNPEKQEAIDLHGSIGASGRNRHEWDAIHWPRIEQAVQRLQRRIAQADSRSSCIRRTRSEGLSLNRSLSRVRGNLHARF
jgi:hypothetical protein